jgi:hypothetical protein
MKRLLPLFFFACAALPLAGQVTLTHQRFPKVGDTLRIAVDNLPANLTLGGPGPNQRWDFTNLQSPFTQQTVARAPSMGQGAAGFPNANVMILLAENLEGYYRASDREFSLLGYYGVDPLNFSVEALTRFQPPIPEYRAPLRYLDAARSETSVSLPIATEELPRVVLLRLPITPDSLRIRINAKREDLVDAWGKLIIPGGIHDVLREKRVETRDTRLDAKIGFLPWQDITGLIPNIEALGKITTVSYHFMSNEAKEPIAVVYLDAAERLISRVEYKASDRLSTVQTIGELKPGVYAFPNPAIVNVRFEFTNLPPGEYTLSIYSILGLKQWSQQYYVNSNRTEKVNISSLRKGTYLYSLSDARGRTISTKRLVVIKP